MPKYKGRATLQHTNSPTQEILVTKAKKIRRYKKRDRMILSRKSFSMAQELSNRSILRKGLKRLYETNNSSFHLVLYLIISIATNSQKTTAKQF